MFGLDLFTLGIAFLFFVVILSILWDVISHRFHVDIGEIFIGVIVAVAFLGLGFLVLNYLIN